MASSSSPVFSTIKPRPRASLSIAAVLCPISLVITAAGFWQWSILLINRPKDPTDLFNLLVLIVVPLTIAVIATFFAAQRMEYDKFFVSFQSRIDQMQKRLNAEEELLSSLTEHNPEAVAIFDRNNNYWFVNASAARLLGASNVKEVAGMPSTKYAHIENALKLTGRLNEVRNTKRPAEALYQVPTKTNQICFLQTYYEPVKLTPGMDGGVMVRWQDVTTLMVQRERSENMLRQLIATLVSVVDRRDPYSIGHSEHVSFLARAIAEEMVLSEREIEAAAVAGSLMNFGKILVPRSILTKKEQLTTEELRLVREAMLSSADILSMIDFSAPVVPALKQTQERYDGTGLPYGLKGDQILVTARIIAVANSYVAMVSPRAHRAGLTPQQGLEALRGMADKALDPKVVAALANYLQNRKNKPDWLDMTKLA